MSSGKPHEGSPRAARREVEVVLQHYGLSLSRAVRSSDGEAESLGLALGALGPLAQELLDELASRADLLAPDDRAALAAVASPAEPSSPSAVRRLCESELGGSFDALDFDQLRAVACDAGIETHATVTRAGEPVFVRFVTPRLERSVVDDVDALGAIAELEWIGADDRQVPLRRGIEELLGDLGGRWNLRVERENLEELARLGGRFVVPRDDPSWTTRRITIFENLESAALSSLEGEARRQGCLRWAGAWLRLALLEGWAWEDPDRLVRLHEKRLVVAGGRWERLAESERLSLERLLVACAVGDPDGAADRFVELSEERAPSAAELRPALRQAGPLRDRGVATDAPAGRPLVTFADELYLLVRLARHRGWRPRRSVAAALAGLSRLAARLEELAPEDDLLAVALRRYRWRRAEVALERLSAPARWLPALARETPRVVTRMERLFGPDGATRESRSRAPRRARGGRGLEPLDRVALVVVLLSLALCARPWSEAALGLGVPILRAGAFTLLGSAAMLAVASAWLSRSRRRRSRS